MSESVREIAARVAADNGLTLEELRRPNRSARYAWPRQRAMVEMYATGRVSTTWIAKFFGQADHTSVIYARKAVARRKARSPQPVHVSGDNPNFAHSVAVLDAPDGV